MNDRRAAARERADAPVLAPGHVWLAGAGPGDPGLLTLDALAGLSQADVVVHDALVDRRVLAFARPQARLEFAGKRGGRPSADQNDISIRLIELARTGQPIVLYMAMRNLANIADQLMHGGLPPRTPVAVVVSATTADERIVVSTLDRVAADAQMNQLGTPSIIVIGDIVKLREGLADSTRAVESEAAS